MLNVDIDERVLPDLVFDLSQELKFPLKLASQRLGKIELEENQFDEIIANDVLEHVPDLTTLMTNCLKLLKEGGEFNINVPYDLSFGAWQDPTHIRAFNQKSWLYFTDWSWYLGWLDERFELANLKYVLSETGEKLHASGMPVNELADRPRAVNSMKVKLVKRKNTPQERQIARAYSPAI